ncbi:MAG: ClpXP protease specificity-enhancing factor [Ectothiorhodospiraceae bacterium AqS1]|nr:ClpXP protease specificity-enhancing factor [Ectothiorhodospiraceae bacterium AqS1]
MSSSRPYLVRAIREWIIDNDLTPLIIVDAKREGVKAPAGTERDGKIVFNISDSAVYRLVIDNRRVEFSARFGGRSSDISIPHHALLAIVARENGVGMSFPLDEEEQDDDARAEKTDGPTLIEEVAGGGQSAILEDSNPYRNEASEDPSTKSPSLPPDSQSESPAEPLPKSPPDLRVIK